jgi:phosphotransferase system HPr (HPr) family protein
MTLRGEVTVTNPSGLHARPAARFVETARTFDSELSLGKDGRTGNAKSLVSVLRLGIVAGTTIEITADGPDEEQALAALMEVLRTLAAAE